jgi:biotin carboxyl carrier protein
MHWLLQAPAAGEVAAYNAEEGDPVEYQQVLVQIAPSFGVEEAGVTQHRL